MKCSKCNYKNRFYDNYCLKCGYEFSAKEKIKAKNKTFFGIIDNIEKWYNRLSLKVITDNTIFKTVSLIVVLGIGVYFLISMHNSVRIIENDRYMLQYNNKSNEYYLISEELEEVTLDIFIPNRCKSIDINHYDNKNNELEKRKYKPKDKIVLKTGVEDYYIFTANYLNNKKDKLKLYVYKKDDIEIKNK